MKQRLATELYTILTLLSGVVLINCSPPKAPQVDLVATETVDPDSVPLSVIARDAGVITLKGARDYCTYRVINITNGRCPDLQPNTLMCIYCPENGRCPGNPGAAPSGRFRLVDENGETICEGTWAMRFRVDDPNGCLNCPDSVRDRYRFVN